MFLPFCIPAVCRKGVPEKLLPDRAKKTPKTWRCWGVFFYGKKLSVDALFFMTNIVEKRKKGTDVSDVPFLPPLDTLAQLPTKGFANLKKRARSKWYTNQIVKHLCEIDSPLTSYYRSSLYCGHIITQRGDKLTSQYCNTRCCNVCNRIRTAKMINGYLNQVIDRPALEFVTLTQGPTCTAENLPFVIRNMIRQLTLIMRVFRERRGIPINGVRKLEVTYRPKTDLYHPHLHMIVDKAGKQIIEEWLYRFPNADIKAQDLRSADSNSVKELFKYATKIAVGKDFCVDSATHKIDVYLRPLDVIFRSLKGKRIFQPFGNIKKVDEDIIALDAQTYTDIPKYTFVEWIWENHDWYSPILATNLTGYTPPGNLYFEVYE